MENININAQSTEVGMELDYEEREKRLVQWVVSLYSIALLTSSVFFLLSFKLGMLLFVAVAVYTIAGFKAVSSNERGVVRLFGEAVKEVGSGLCFAPPLLCELKSYSKQIQVIEIGSPLENDKGEIIEIPTREGVVINDLPFRISLKGNPKGESVLERPLTIDPRIQLQWMIKSPIVFDEQKRDTHRANNELVDVVKSATQKILANKS